MKNKSAFKPTSFLLVAFLLLPSVSQAGEQCRALFNERGISWSKLSTREQRSSLLTELKTKSVPAFLKNSSHGPIPVVLVNASTAPKIDDFMKNSVGMQIVLQPEDNYSDHGLARIGGVKASSATMATQDELTNLQVDWALPDTRNWEPTSVAEIHSTGLAWRDLDALMRKAAAKGNYSKVTIELSFAATQKQRLDLEYYHRARRAALIAVHTPDWKGDLKPDVPNLIPATCYREDCFDLSRGRSFKPIAQFIEGQMLKAGVSNFKSYLKDPKTKAFLRQARLVIMAADAWNPQDLNHSVLARSEKANSLGQLIIPEELRNAKPNEIESFLNSLATYDALRSAERLYKALKINGDIFPRNNLENPKLAAVLIYAPAAEAERFVNATFTAHGKFRGSGWGEDLDGQSPYGDQYPIQY